MADYVVRLTGQDNLSGTIKNVKSAVNDLGSSASTSIDKFTQKFQRIEQSTAPLKKQLRDLKAIMAEMQFSGLSNTSEFTQIAQYAGQISDAMNDASAATKRFADDTLALSAATSAVQGIAGGFTAVTGAMNLFGVKNEEVAEAIMKVQSAMAILNGVQAVANMINKDSALMQGMKALQMKLATTATTENTVSTNINTVSETANKAATQAMAAAEAKDVIAKGAQTAATKSATIAQLANNAAVLANPYVLAAAAVVALTGALIAWIASSDEATESELSLAAATEAMSEQMDGATKTAADQISAYMDLKNEYDNCGGSVDEIKKKIIDNTDKQKKAQIQVTNLDKATRIFSSDGARAFIQGCNARAMAMAAEAAIAATYAKVLKGLNDALNKIGSGQEVNISEVEKYAEELGIAKDKFKEMAFAAGYKEDWRAFSKNDLSLKDGVDAMKAQQELITNMFQYSIEHGTLSTLSKMADNWKADAKAVSLPIDDILDPDGGNGKGGNGGSGGSSSRGHKQVQKNHAQTNKAQQKTIELTKQNNEEWRKTLNTLDGCNAIIKQADQEINKLDKTTGNYNEKLKQLKDIRLIAKVKKLEFIDQTTLKGLMDYKKTINEILEELPDGSPQIENLNNKIEEANAKIEEIYKKRVASGKKEDLEDLKKYYEELIPTLKHLSAEETDALRKLKGVEDQLKHIEREQNNAKLGISKHSVTFYKQEYEEALKQYQDFINNEDLNIVCQLGMEVDDNGELRESLREQYYNAVQEAAANLGNARALQKLFEDGGLKVTSNSFSNSLDFGSMFDYKKDKLEIISREFDKITAKIEELKQIKLEDVGEDAFKKAQKSLDEYYKEHARLKKLYRDTELTQDIKEYTKTLSGQTIDGTKNFVGGINSMYQAFDGLAQKIDDAKNGWEQFIAVFETIFTVIDGVKSAYDTITELTETIRLLTGAKEAMNAVTQQTAANTIAETAATEANTVATAAEAGVSASNAVAKGSEAAATAGVAVAETAAQNAKMGPFGWIAGIAGAVALAGVLFSLIGKFADGGIVGGSSYSGDKLIARVNSGEMILNGRQQKNLFNAINKNELGGSDNAQSISFKIKGSDLYGTLKNYSKIKGKSGVNTGIQ